MKEENNTTAAAPEEPMSQEGVQEEVSVDVVDEKTSHSYGTIIAIGIIAIIILGGAFYFYSTRVASNGPNQADLEAQFQAAQNNAQKEISTIETQSDSTSIDAIQADLNASDVSDLDAEISSINQELGL